MGAETRFGKGFEGLKWKRPADTSSGTTSHAGVDATTHPGRATFRGAPVDLSPSKPVDITPPKKPIHSARTVIGSAVRTGPQIGDRIRLKKEMHKLSRLGPFTPTKFVSTTQNANGEVMPVFQFGKGSQKARRRARIAAGIVNSNKSRKEAERHQKRKARSIFK